MGVYPLRLYISQKVCIIVDHFTSLRLQQLVHTRFDYDYAVFMKLFKLKIMRLAGSDEAKRRG